MVLQWFAFVGWLTCEAGLESTDYTLCFVAHGIMLLLLSFGKADILI